MRGLLAAPGRLRRPYNAENYFPRALQRTEFIIYRFCPRSPAYSAESARGAGLFLIIFNSIYAGGHRIYKTPPRRPLLRPPLWSFLLLICRHRKRRKLQKP